MVKPKIDIIYFDAGGGHRAAAVALEAEMQDKWQVKLLNLREQMDDLDFFKRYTGISVEKLYNNLMSSNYGYLVASKFGLYILHKLINHAHDKIVQRAISYWKTSNPDIIVSVIPNFNRSLFEAANSLKKPYVTIMLDMIDCYKNFWIEAQDQYIIVGNGLAATQALAKLSQNKVFRVNGQIVHPRFYKFPRSNIYNNRLTGLVCFGGYGSNKMLKIEKVLKQVKSFINLEFICGHNNRLKRELTSRGASTWGFIDLAEKMSQSDFLIGKPGPGIINEALVTHLPLFLDNNHPLIQERYNLQWVAESHVGVGADVTDPDQFKYFLNNIYFYERNINKYKPDAIFTIPKILEKLI